MNRQRSRRNELHPTQKKLLELLKRWKDEPRTIRELMEALDLKYPNLVYHHIEQLENKGYLKRNPNNPKDYEIVSDPEESNIVYLNRYGEAQCGPNGTILDGDPVERIPLSRKMLPFSSSDGFIVKARGNSMIPRIKDGDLVIAKKASDANDKALIVCVQNGKVLIKQLRKSETGILLLSLNDEFDPITINPDKDDFKIEGEVKLILSYT
ncbi:S24 family peptidase [Leptospira interrogans]|uniref:Repressor LexA n=9 Tax=Leptospira interrogans TaxID=173 RepID=A0A829CT70_LEPIR|nr:MULTISPECIES: S24 family peptidase [Leptospira]APH42450.1 Peptidase S24-like protein [Leptospira interrogans serovar Copenhageni/Icterohaemorrhagiae]EMF43128.1 repressor LexA [Leptospira interrogans serovar Lora str. TE 1992]EMG19210.1 repressor LexA [Leptospira interrogans serovar Copenhageni str. LT2050]EMN29758.1 repressor LexA [Leptospira interrogans serovar Pyrogenes str. L0374]EMY02083.1 repressor LexA [Leptospira interrogans str. 2002000626]EMY23715.1 repressor LexA [Leptospira inte